MCTQGSHAAFLGHIFHEKRRKLIEVVLIAFCVHLMQHESAFNTLVDVLTSENVGGPLAVFT